MPAMRCTAGTTPQATKAASITSVSEWPRKAWPQRLELPAQLGEVVDLAIEDDVERPSSDRIGWWPRAERSRIESRRCPSATPASASSQAPASSGPRCATASVMARKMDSASRPSPPERPESCNSAHGYCPPARKGPFSRPTPSAPPHRRTAGCTSPGSASGDAPPMTGARSAARAAASAGTCRSRAEGDCPSAYYTNCRP